MNSNRNRKIPSASKPNPVVFPSSQTTNPNLNHTQEHLKRYTHDAITSTTIHGIDKIFTPRHSVLKIIWIVFFLASTGGCAYFIANSIIEYLRFEVVTKIQVFYEKPQLFPTVAVCNSNLFPSNESVTIAKQLLANQNLPDPFGDTSIAGLNFTLAQTNILVKYLIAANLKNPQLSPDVLKIFNTSFENFIYSCTFNLLPCDASMFKPYFDDTFGSCFIFNYKDIKPTQFYSSRSGFLNSLKLELFINDSVDPYTFSQTASAYVAILNASETKLDFNGIFASVGAKTYIGVG